MFNKYNLINKKILIKKKQPITRVELVTFSLRGRYNNHYAKQASVKDTVIYFFYILLIFAIKKNI